MSSYPEDSPAAPESPPGPDTTPEPSAWAPRPMGMPRFTWPATPAEELSQPGSVEPPPPAGHSPGDGGGASVRVVAAVAGAAALCGGLLAGGIVAWLDRDTGDQPATATSTTQLTVEQTSAITNAVATARPAVVRIESTQRTSVGTEQDVGSGVVMDDQGHIVTNAHVVLNTDSLKVVLADGTTRPAILIGHDYPFSDVAVLQVSPGSLTVMPFGNSDALKLGQSVVAIGNPLAKFDGSVSVGVVSGVNRTRTFDGVRQDDLIQTDAAVNNGNSGGALINLDGQFIGMPTAIIRQSGSGQTVEGIAFALPANRVGDIAQRIIQAGGVVPRPSLEADHVDLDPASPPRGVRLAVREGAVITALSPGGAADAAGIQLGDVITKFGDTEINADTPLLNGLLAVQPGDTVKVVLNRNGRIIETEVKLARRS